VTAFHERACLIRTTVSESGERARIHVVDDDPGFRASLADLLESMGYEVAAYGSTAEFLARGEISIPGCLVLDVRLPEMSGLDLQEKLGRDGVKLPVILMTGFGDIAMSVRGMKAGARNFIEKPFRDQDMLDAVAEAVAASRQDVPVTQRKAALAERYASLTPREREVLHFVVRGLLNKQIAHALSISEVTVKIHRSGVMRKMQAGSIAEISRMADILGL
jgi:FixJ family two-component response regulator